ncbi:MAG TPA: type II toxin-antitoxin system HipA family toxin [Noviherbaspirillum sp.]|nr:type II toxin-antitoxin system HipA family toxin [Noviherbaspirillum sp.]
MQALNAWMNGELVGTWRVDRHSHTFSYAPSWLESTHRRSLSLSLPISSSLEIKGEVVKHYFDNLLPDNERIRERLGRRFKLKSKETFDLLEAIGRDCVGAVQLLPENETPDGWDRIECEALTEEEIVGILHAVPSEDTWELDDDDLFRISIAGAQEKTALMRYHNKWCRPHGATPTTHILKLPLGLIGGMKRVDAWDSVQNEWLCARIISALKLPVAPTSIAGFGDQTVLVVERFDREWMDNGTWIARLPQEDLCQALGVPPDRKYEQHGGPGMQDCLQLMAGSRDKGDRAFFLLTQLAFFLLAAPDGHAKNFSIHLQRGDEYEMTPLYDVLSMWPYFGDGNNQFKQRKAGLAMAIRSRNAHYHFHTIQARHWKQLAMKNGGQAVWEDMVALVESVDEALAEVEGELPKDFPAKTWEAISTGMRGEAKRFLVEVEMLAKS